MAADYSLGTARGQIVLDYDDKGVKQAEGGLEKAGSSVGRFAKTAVGTLAIIGGTIAGIAVGGGISRALNIQDAEAKLRGLGNTTEDISRIMESATAAVTGTAFGLDKAATVAASAVAAGIKPGEELTKYLTLTADAATIAGVSLDEMGSIINKTTTSGKVYTDNLNQLADRGIPIFQWLQDEYGVSAEKLSEMVSNGEVDAATFRKVIEENIGGAAQASGKTVRGALSNMMAAFSRFGAIFVSGPISAAPTLLTAFNGAIDRGTKALKPFATMLGERVSAAMIALAGYIDGLDIESFANRIAAAGTRVIAVFDYIQGFISGEGSNADVGPYEDFAVFLATWAIRIGHYAQLVGGFIGYIVGYISGDGYSGVDIGWLEGPAEAIAGVLIAVGNAIKGFTGGGDISGQFSSIGESLKTLGPAFAAFGAELPNVAGAVGKLAGAGLNILTATLGFLADNIDTIIAFMPLIIAGFLAWRVANDAVVGASYALRAAELAAAPVYFANNLMRLQSVSIERQLAVAKGTANAATTMGIATTLRETVAKRASQAATIAQMVATRAASAAQWLWNAAMSANPIGIVIVAIAALVAGLIWFFTQTELGQQLWAGFTSFLGDAFSNVASFIGTAITGIVGFFQNFWNVVQTVWGGIIAFLTPIVTFFVTAFQVGIATAVSIVTGIFNFFSTTIQTVFAAVMAFIMPFVIWFATYVGPLIVAIVNLVAAIFNYLVSVVVFVWNAIMLAIQTFIAWIVATLAPIIAAVVAAVTAYFTAMWQTITMIWNAISSAIDAAVNFISNVINSVFSAISSFVMSVMGAIGAFISSVWNTIYNAISGAVNRAWGIISGVWSSISGFVRGVFNDVYNAIKGPIDRAVDVIGGIKDRIVGFFSGAASWLASAGRDIIQGLIGGIQDMIGNLTSTLNGITNLIPESKGPPEKDKVLLTPAGRMIMQGLIGGFQDEIPNMKSALGDVTQSIPLSVQQDVNANIANRRSNVTPIGNTSNVDIRVEGTENPIAWARAAARELNNSMAGAA
jgi:tape measure domain-containing protein